MEIKTLTKDDTEKAIDIYARCMSESDYFKSLFHLRRESDADELAARLAMEHGKMLEKAVAYGTSFGAWEAGRLAGIQINFWYNVVRQHDAKLFGLAFRDGAGNIAEETGMHGRIAALGGAVLYNLALCTDPEYRRDRVAVRLMDATKYRLRPEWIAAAVHGTDALPIYMSQDCEAYKLDDGRILCTVRV